jgi:hypothetical protein
MRVRGDDVSASVRQPYRGQLVGTQREATLRAGLSALARESKTNR